MPLFKVSVEVEFYMDAEDEDDAYCDAGHYAKEALADGGATVAWVREVKTGERIPPDWLAALPYGGDGERTISQILDDEAGAPKPDTQTIDMFKEPR